MAGGVYLAFLDQAVMMEQAVASDSAMGVGGHGVDWSAPARASTARPESLPYVAQYRSNNSGRGTPIRSPGVRPMVAR